MPMHPMLERATGFEDLLRTSDHDLPYRFDTIFSDESWGKRRLSRKKLELLRRIDEELREMLAEGEEVRFLTQGLCYAFWESYFLGWLLYSFSQRAIVLTDRRILFLQIGWCRTPKDLRSQIRYQAIQKIGRAWLGGTKLKLKSGQKIYLGGVPRADRKLLRRLVDRLQDVDMVDWAPVEEKEDLCPHCNRVTSLGLLRCAECGGTFKSPKKAGLLSLLFPGLGDFYMRQRKLATLEIVFVALIWVVMLLPTPEYPLTLGGGVVLAGFLVLFVHAPDALGTWYLAKRGVYPHRPSETPSLSEVVAGRGGPSRW